jgi:hypothetical protein
MARRLVKPAACASVRPRIGTRCADRAGGACGFKFTLADCHVSYREKSLNRSGASSVYRTVC